MFIVTLYSLQKNTRFVDHVEQKVTTNPKLGENHKSRSNEEAALLLCFDCVHCNLMDGQWTYEMVIYVLMEPSKNLRTINSENSQSSVPTVLSKFIT